MQPQLLAPATRPFACNHCGGCCSTVLHTVAGPGMIPQGTFGILLRPQETRVFARADVAPFWRERVTVLAYQVAVEPCPHWSGARCAIYGERPLACRAYPVWWEFVWWANNACPQVAQSGPPVEVQGYAAEVRAAHDIVRFQRWLYGSHEDLEYFDLARGEWRVPDAS